MIYKRWRVNMKKIKKLLTMAMATVMVTASLVGCGAKEETTTGGDTATGDKIKVGVFLYKFDDTYISTVRQSLENFKVKIQIKLNLIFMMEKVTKLLKMML